MARSLGEYCVELNVAYKIDRGNVWTIVISNDTFFFDARLNANSYVRPNNSHTTTDRGWLETV